LGLQSKFYAQSGMQPSSRKLHPTVERREYARQEKFQLSQVWQGCQQVSEECMKRRKKGTLKSGKGGKAGKVKSRKQAIAIGLSEARKKGAKVPKKKKSKS
jgi:transcription elongation GreA/GreB family factor